MPSGIIESKHEILIVTWMIIDVDDNDDNCHFLVVNLTESFPNSASFFGIIMEFVGHNGTIL